MPEDKQHQANLLMAIQLLLEARDRHIHKHATFAFDNTQWNCVTCSAWGMIDGGKHKPECFVARIDQLLYVGALIAKHDDGHPHRVGGEFQSDKYPSTPRGKVPLSVKDKTAQDLLWTYALRRRAVDVEFADDLEMALMKAGYNPVPPPRPSPSETFTKG